MGLSFLPKLFARGTYGGLFGYLTACDANRTTRAIEQDRNKTEIEIRKDWNRTLIDLERERRVTAREVIEQLGEAGEYRDSTIVGERQIRKTQVPPVTYVVLPDNGGEPPAGESSELPPASYDRSTSPPAA